MKLTYTAPNRAHHYPYAKALHAAGALEAFVSGFSRYSPRAAIPEIGDKLHRQDFYQNLFIMGLKFKLGSGITNFFNCQSNRSLDDASYKYALKSDAFVYYRTQGKRTNLKLKKNGASTITVLEEVNSHVDICHDLMKTEYEKLGLGKYTFRFTDHSERLDAYQEADLILCPSEFVKRSFLSKGFNEDKLLKVNFGFPPVTTTNGEKQFSKDGFRVLYVGQVNFRKGLRYAIEAFKKLEAPNKKFIIVGPNTECTGLEGMTMPEGVEFTGALKGDDLANQYRSADVFVLPSLEEGLALVQAEALSYGVPIIITENTGGDDLIVDGQEGFVLEPGNAEAIREKFQQLADDRVMLEEMSSKAFAISKSIKGWDYSATNLLNQIKENKIVPAV